MAVLVRALCDGFFNGYRRRAGSEFHIPDEVKPGKWMEVVKPKAPEAKAAPAKPVADKKPAGGKEDSLV